MDLWVRIVVGRAAFTATPLDSAQLDAAVGAVGKTAAPAGLAQAGLALQDATPTPTW